MDKAKCCPSNSTKPSSHFCTPSKHKETSGFWCFYGLWKVKIGLKYVEDQSSIHIEINKLIWRWYKRMIEYVKTKKGD